MDQYITDNSPCGTITSSSCVSYTGKKISSLPESSKYYTLSKVIESIDSLLVTVKASIDISSVDTTSIGIETGKANLTQLLQVILTNLGLIKNQLNEISNKSTDNILATPVPVDLSPLISPCDGDTLTPLLTVLTTLINEVAILKNNN